MKTPWFMHQHQNKNTLVGVYSTPLGSYMRSHSNDITEVTFYPLDLSFENGTGRMPTDIGRFSHSGNPAVEDQIDAAIEEDFSRRMLLPVTKGVKNDPLVGLAPEVISGALSDLADWYQTNECGASSQALTIAGRLVLMAVAGGSGNEPEIGRWKSIFAIYGHDWRQDGREPITPEIAADALMDFEQWYATAEIGLDTHNRTVIEALLNHAHPGTDAPADCVALAAAVGRDITPSP